MPSFYEMESSFLSGIYKRYGDIESGNIVIFFARDLHLEILRKREIDLNFNLSLDEFWNNHKNIVQKKKTIITIAKSTGLPRETARRKIISLIETKHIKKTEKNTIFWEPDSKSKDSYIKIIEEQIKSLSKFSSFPMKSAPFGNQTCCGTITLAVCSIIFFSRFSCLKNSDIFLVSPITFLLRSPSLSLHSPATLQKLSSSSTDKPWASCSSRPMHGPSSGGTRVVGPRPGTPCWLPG